MAIKIKKILIALSLLVAVFAVAHLALAAAGLDVGLEAAAGTGLSAVNDPRIIAANIIRIILGFLGIIAVGLIIFAGWLWMTAEGEAEKVEKAKKILTGAVIGLVIGLASFAIASFILNSLLDATGVGTNNAGTPGGGGISSGGGTTGGLPGEGQACLTNSLDTQCAAGQCAAGLSCSSSSCVCEKDSGPGEGESCDAELNLPSCQAADCADNLVCSPNDNCSCVKMPLIAWVSPMDASSTPNGAMGNFITIGGSYFGTTTGQVIFMGDPNNLSDDKVATFPNLVNPLCASFWQDDQIIAVVPGGAVSGPIKVVDGKNYYDTTDNNRGARIKDFSVNNIKRPGICNIDPASGGLADKFNLQGSGFNVSPHSVFFGNGAGAIAANDIAGWTNTAVNASVPNIKDGKSSVFVRTNNINSNDLVFTIRNNINSNPAIEYIEPNKGPAGQYITIYGRNFKIYNAQKSSVKFYSPADPNTKINADIDFPEACRNNWWHDTYIIVKVPKVYGLGVYKVEVTNTDNKISLPADFTINNETPTPGLCLLNPNNGPVGWPVTANGERFGSSQASGRVQYFNNKDGAIRSWADKKVDTNVPVNSVSGPFKIIDGQGYVSNSLPFRVGKCSASSECESGEECCGGGTYWSGICRATGTCAQGSPISCAFGWTFSTKASPLKVTAWIPQGDNICRNSAIKADFNQPMNPETLAVSAGNILLVSDYGANPCPANSKPLPSGAAGENFCSLDGSIIVSGGQTAVEFKPTKVLEPDRQYYVIIKGDDGGVMSASGEKLIAAGAYTLDTRAFNGATYTGKIWWFKTKSQITDNSGFCLVNSVVINPSSYTYTLAGSNKEFLALAYSSDSQQLTTTADYSWNWGWSIDKKTVVQFQSGENGAANSAAQTLIAQNVGNDMTLVHAAATITVDNISKSSTAGAVKKGTAEVKVCTDGSCADSTDLKVTDWMPKGDNICRNSSIQATFNQPMKIDTLATSTGNILLVSDYGANPCPANSKPLPSGAAGENFCSLDGIIIPSTGGGKTVVEFRSRNVLEADRQYYVIIKGGDGGVMSVSGKKLITAGTYTLDTRAFNGATYTGKIWWFKTKSKITANSGFCLVDAVVIRPANYTFTSKDNNPVDDNLIKTDGSVNSAYDTVNTDSDKEFKGLAYSSDSQQLIAMADYNWNWGWSIEKKNVVQFKGGENGLDNSATQTLIAQNVKNDLSLVHAATTITVDNISESSTAGEIKNGTAEVKVDLCTNGTCPPEPLNPLTVTDWLPQGNNICRNSLVQATFNQTIQTNNLSSNVLLVGDYGASQCPANTKYLTAAYSASWFEKIKSWLAGLPLINKFLPAPARALEGNFCAAPGSVSGYVKADKTAVLEFKLQQVLEANRKYYVIIKGDSNMADSVKDGVISVLGETLSETETSIFNGVTYAGKIWSFTTKPDTADNKGICLVNGVAINPSGYLFNTTVNNPADDSGAGDQTIKDSDKIFSATAYFAPDQPIVPIENVYNWRWDWSIDDKSVVKFKNGENALDNNPAQTLVAQNVKEANTLLHTKATITQDQVSQSSTVGQFKENAAEVYVFLCANPWPPFKNDGSWAPWRDASGNCTPGTGGCSDTNFALYYCRDAGEAGTADDLPAILSDTAVIRGSSAEQNILKEFYFFREATPNVAGANLATTTNDTIKQGGKVGLVWSPAASAQKYTIYYGTTATSLTQSVTAAAPGTAASPFIVSNLTNGIKYYFAVTATYSTGAESDYSNKTTAVPADTWPPQIPQSLTGATTTAGVILSWTANTDDTAIYKIYYGATSGSLGASVNLEKSKCSAATLKCEITISNLTVGVTYYFAVSALDLKANESSKSGEIHLIIE